MGENKKPLSSKMRIWHRYLGFFLAGVMAVYALSGIVLIFRDTDFLKQEKIMQKNPGPGLTAEALGKEIRKNNLKFSKTEGDTSFFEGGKYNTRTGAVSYEVKELPKVLTALTQLHKASTGKPLFFLNVFFGASLLFFVISAFWMFRPSTDIFRKGLCFTIAGIVLVLILLYV